MTLKVGRLGKIKATGRLTRPARDATTVRRPSAQQHHRRSEPQRARVWPVGWLWICLLLRKRFTFVNEGKLEEGDAEALDCSG
jgi:hypothetical protein